jgi:hypothetical protein
MHQIVSLVGLVGRVLILPALAGVVLGWSSDQPVQAEVQRVSATAYDTGDADLAGFKLNFGVQLTNRSGRYLSLPKSGTADDGITRVWVQSVQAKQPDGGWSSVVQSSWYDSGSVKYESCTALKTDSKAELTNLPSAFVILKSQAAKLGSKPMVRFNLWVFCREKDGKVVISSARTDEFGLPLTAQR